MSRSGNILVQIDNISEDDLYLIEKDLSFQEKASVAFLLFGDNKVNAEVMVQKLLVSHLNKDNVSDILIHFSTQRPDWKEVMVEALAIVRANKILRKLGLKFSEVKNHFLPHIREASLHINQTLKVLYFICELLTPVQAADIVLSVERNQDSTNHFRFYNFENLEVFLMNWIAKGRMDVSGGRTTDVSMLAQYFKLNSMNNFMGILSDLTKRMIPPVHTPRDNAEQENINENSLALDKMRISESWKECNENSLKNVEISAICDRPRGARQYIIDRETAGFILIINQKTFEPPTDPELKKLLKEPLKPRNGTELDRDKLISTFSQRGYKPIVKENLDHLDILSQAREVVYRSIICHSVIVCILSHGDKGCVYGSDSVAVQIDEVKEILTDKRLENKPKMLIIQACQGGDVQKRVHLEHDGRSSNNYYDMVVANATIPGFAALRDPGKGTWFIQTLCDKIEELADEEDIMGILTAVNDAIDTMECNLNVRMTPISSSTLRKKFMLPKRMVSS